MGQTTVVGKGGRTPFCVRAQCVLPPSADCARFAHAFEPPQSFGADLFGRLCGEKEENCFMSPLSIASALVRKPRPGSAPPSPRGPRRGASHSPRPRRRRRWSPLARRPPLRRRPASRPSSAWTCRSPGTSRCGRRAYARSRVLARPRRGSPRSKGRPDLANNPFPPADSPRTDLAPRARAGGFRQPVRLRGRAALAGQLPVGARMTAPALVSPPHPCSPAQRCDGKCETQPRSQAHSAVLPSFKEKVQGVFGALVAALPGKSPNSPHVGPPLRLLRPPTPTHNPLRGLTIYPPSPPRRRSHRRADQRLDRRPHPGPHPPDRRRRHRVRPAHPRCPSQRSLLQGRLAREIPRALFFPALAP